MESAKKASNSLVKMVVFLVLYIGISAGIQYVMTLFNLLSYFKYVNAVLVLAFGWYIVLYFADFVYWTMRSKYDHPTAVAFKNMMRIIGIVAIIAAVVGAAVGGIGGLTIGGFLGIVVGFAVQQVTGQAVAGIFILAAKPFKVGDHVNILGEDGIVEDIGAMFTKIRKQDNSIVLIPSSSIIGNKIYLLIQKLTGQ
ncbi:MAG: small-conductance mechanosensitive channel-like protein [Caldisphaera sp.]|nr:MAG: small-conductance mechanosensitive channel-like protein [Caldisphaera sp.]PMP91165.1 MAG: small-conductance mechanosensitive channel-like protein [Caldisphaera sp.]